MPTGYTAAVQSGEITTFREYARSCARACGVLFHMRDDSADTPIPEEIKPSEHHREQLERCTLRLAELEAMDAADAELAAQTDYAAAVASVNDRQTQKAAQKQRYEAMLEKARKFKAPSPEHEGYATFIVSQLESSIDWDCNSDYVPRTPVQLSGAEWKAAEIAAIQESIEYHRKNYADECASAAGKTQFLKQLLEAIDAVESPETKETT